MNKLKAQLQSCRSALFGWLQWVAFAACLWQQCISNGRRISKHFFPQPTDQTTDNKPQELLTHRRVWSEKFRKSSEQQTQQQLHNMLLPNTEAHSEGVECGRKLHHSFSSSSFSSFIIKQLYYLIVTLLLGGPWNIEQHVFRWGSLKQHVFRWGSLKHVFRWGGKILAILSPL